MFEFFSRAMLAWYMSLSQCWKRKLRTTKGFHTCSNGLSSQKITQRVIKVQTKKGECVSQKQALSAPSTLLEEPNVLISWRRENTPTTSMHSVSFLNAINILKCSTFIPLNFSYNASLENNLLLQHNYSGTGFISLNFS